MKDDFFSSVYLVFHKTLMRNLKTWQLYALLTATIVCGLAISGSSFWCQEIGGCSFGRYEAKISLTDSESKDPIRNQNIEIYTDYSGSPIILSRDRKTVTTDRNGQVTVKFRRDSKYPLAISTYIEKKETGRTFFIESKYIQAKTTVSQEHIESYSLGDPKDIVELNLRVDN